MNAVDLAWLEMDDPHNPMVVSAILEFDRVGSLRVLTTRLVERLLAQPRFRQRVVKSRGRHEWIEDAELNLAYHVQPRLLADPDSEDELRKAIGTELAHSLDKASPLWRVSLFPRSGDRVTVLFRAHHAVADGVALLQLLLELGDGAAQVPGDVPVWHHHGPLAGILDRLESVNAALESAVALVVDDFRHPGHLAQQFDATRHTVAAVGRIATLPDDNPPCFRVRPCGRRAVAWVGNLSLPAVRKFARSQGVTVNDVFLVALAGAFGQYLRTLDPRLSERQNLRVSIPVNLRDKDDRTLGNRFGLVLLDLPVGVEGFHARLEIISDRMEALKKSPEARGTLIALAAAGHLPVSVEKSLVNVIAGKAGAVVSNLPGPRRRLLFAGARLDKVVFWPPQAARVGIGVSLLSYGGRITVGISSDTAQLPHPQRVIDAFCAELKSMLGRNPVTRDRHPTLKGVTHAQD